MTSKEEYSVKFIKFTGGERYPILVNDKGVPHWYVTLFTTTQIRNASKAPNTAAAVLSAIRVLFKWTHLCTIDLESRFAKQNFLTEQELESLRSYTQAKAIGTPGKVWLSKRVKFPSGKGLAIHPELSVAA